MSSSDVSSSASRSLRKPPDQCWKFFGKVLERNAEGGLIPLVSNNRPHSVKAARRKSSALDSAGLDFLLAAFTLSMRPIVTDKLGEEHLLSCNKALELNLIDQFAWRLHDNCEHLICVTMRCKTESAAAMQ